MSLVGRKDCCGFDLIAHQLRHVWGRDNMPRVLMVVSLGWNRVEGSGVWGLTFEM